MQTVKNEKLFELCKLLEIKTFEDLKDFKRREQRNGETVLEALNRYIEELKRN